MDEEEVVRVSVDEEEVVRVREGWTRRKWRG